MKDEQAREVLKKHAAAFGDDRYQPARWVIDALQDSVATERERLSGGYDLERVCEACLKAAEGLSNTGNEGAGR